MDGLVVLSQTCERITVSWLGPWDRLANYLWSADDHYMDLQAVLGFTFGPFGHNSKFVPITIYNIYDTVSTTILT